ncbi:hypothetical protein BDR26DRAFT_69407 [Obelidium mucronatum]|nr:hypothetical protein BDR26DRAFT_69407 [Obelidium mucronatum]
MQLPTIRKCNRNRKALTDSTAQHGPQNWTWMTSTATMMNMDQARLEAVGGGGGSQYPQRSMSAPRMGNNNNSSNSNNNNNNGRQSPEMNMQQLYELTVNAYKAGLAYEFDNDERDVRDRGRFHGRSGSVPATSGVSPRAGYPTRAGSLVRFTGEDEVAYDLQRMSSDGSNHSGGGARRAESLQRYNRGNNHDGEEDGDDDEDYRGEDNQEFEEEDRAKYQNHQGDYQDGATTTGTNDLQLASRMTSTPMMQKSVTVDGRYGSGVTNSTSKKPPSIKIPYAEQVVAQASSSSSSSKQGGLGITTDTSGRSKSMDPRLRSPSVESRRSTTSPAALVKSVQQQQSLFSVSGFRSSNPYGLFEDEAAKRKREAAEKAASGTGTPVTAERKAVPSNDKAKQYLLATLFGSGPVKMPTIPRLGSNDSAKRGSGALQQKGNGSPTISETSKSVTTTTVTSTSSVGEKRRSLRF